MDGLMRTIEEASGEEGARMAMRAAEMLMVRDDEWRKTINAAAIATLKAAGSPADGPVLAAINHLRKLLLK